MEQGPDLSLRLAEIACEARKHLSQCAWIAGLSNHPFNPELECHIFFIRVRQTGEHKNRQILNGWRGARIKAPAILLSMVTSTRDCVPHADTKTDTN
jgi:hypothetical protein